MLLKTLAIIYIATILVSQNYAKVVTDDDGNTSEIIWMGELLSKPHFVPGDGDHNVEAMRDVIIGKEVDPNQKPNYITMNGISQMTLLGIEQGHTYKSFFKDLTADNVTLRLGKVTIKDADDEPIQDKDKEKIRRVPGRVYESISAFLNGIGGSYASMNVKGKEVPDDIEWSLVKPPIEPYKVFWRKELLNFRERCKANNYPECKGSRFSPDFKAEKNQLDEKDEFNQEKYMYNADEECDSVGRSEKSQPHNNLKAAGFGKLANIVDSEARKNPVLKVLYGQCKGNNDTKCFRGFNGFHYKWEYLKKLASFCRYNKFLNQENPSGQHCGPKINQMAKYVYDYESYGINTQHIAKVKINGLMKDIQKTTEARLKEYEKEKYTKKDDSKDKKKTIKGEKFRVYMASQQLMPMILQVLGAAQSNQIYSTFITKSANLENLEYLAHYPKRASSLLFKLVSRTSPGKGQYYTVDMYYNGMIVNYCNKKNISQSKCTIDDFRGKWDSICFGSKEFSKYCNLEHLRVRKLMILAAVLLLIVMILVGLYKAWQKEKLLNIRKKNVKARQEAMAEEEETRNQE